MICQHVEPRRRVVAERFVELRSVSIFQKFRQELGNSVEAMALGIAHNTLMIVGPLPKVSRLVVMPAKI